MSEPSYSNSVPFKVFQEKIRELEEAQRKLAEIAERLNPDSENRFEDLHAVRELFRKWKILESEKP